MERRLRLERFKAGSTVSRRGSLWPHTTWPSTPKRYTQPVRHRASRPRTHGAVRLTDWYQYGTSCPAASRPAARARVSPVRASPSPRRSHDSIDTFRYLPRTEPSTESRATVSSQQRNFRIYPVKLPASPPTRNREREREVRAPSQAWKRWDKFARNFPSLSVIEFRSDWPSVPVSGSFDTLSLLSLRELEFTGEQALALRPATASLFFHGVRRLDRFPRSFSSFTFPQILSRLSLRIMVMLESRYATNAVSTFSGRDLWLWLYGIRVFFFFFLRFTK